MRNAASRLAFLASLALFDSLPIILFADTGAVAVRVAFSPGGGTAELVHAALATATIRVDVAMFYFSSEALAQSLCQAARRGVSVRLALDSSTHGAAQRPLMERLASAGVEVRITQMATTAKMHLRAAVIDDRIVLTGAANWSDAADQSNVEDLICAEAPALIPLYRDRIVELFNAGVSPVTTVKRAPRQPSPHAHPPAWPTKEVRVEQMQSWHNPGAAALEQLMTDLRAARKVDIGMYLLTNDQLIETLVGVASQAQVRLIVDAAMIGGASLFDLQTLREAGVRVVSCRKERGIMHLKTAVLDGKVVWSGSANWTKNAMQRNAEDMVRMTSAELAQHYLAVLDRLEQEGRPLEADQLMAASVPTGVEASGLPATGPRLDFLNLRRTPATSLVHQARVRYIPDDEYHDCLLRLIRAARQTIGILMYVMPEHEGGAPFQKAIVNALIQASRRGVYVYLVLYTPPTESDRLASHHGNWAERLRAEGIDVRLSVPGGPLHAKFVAVDQTHLIVGSHNWSEGALSSQKIFESSVMVSLPSPDPRVAEYLFSRNIVSDMRSRPAWERELSVLRQLSGAGEHKRAAILKRAGYTTDGTP